MGAIIGGAAQIAGSLIGGGARRREERAARAQYQQDTEAARDFQFKNTFAGLQNTAEDLTVNQQAANFQTQQTDAALASGLDAVVASGGGGGGAQAIANAALQSKQGLSANIQQQEQANQRLRVQQAAALQNQEAEGAAALQNLNYQQLGINQSQSADRFSAAQDARAQATAGLVQGIGSVAGGVATGGLGELGGLFKKKG